MVELKLNINEYKILLELVYLGSRMINPGTNPSAKEYADVVSKVCSFAEQGGMRSMVEYSNGKYQPNKKFEEFVNQHLTVK